VDFETAKQTFIVFVKTTLLTRYQLEKSIEVINYLIFSKEAKNKKPTPQD
jgi:hypothetical protein